MMIELLQGTSVLPGGYEFQAWLVSSGVFAMTLLKMGMWIKGWKTNGNGSSNGAKTLISLSEGEFRGEVRLLLETQLELMDKMHEAMVSDRNHWSSAISKIVDSMHQTHKDREQDRTSFTQLLTLQQSMADMLDKHSIMLVEHDKSEREIWQQMLTAIESFQIDTQIARAACFAEVASIKEELRV